MWLLKYTLRESDADRVIDVDDVGLLLSTSATSSFFLAHLELDNLSYLLLPKLP